MDSAECPAEELAAPLPEDTAFYRRYLAQLSALYLEVRTAVATAAEESSSDDGCPR